MTAAISGEDSDSEPLFTRIGAMLIQHALDPTPAHYSLCHAYIAGGDGVYAIAIDRLITRYGGLTPQAVRTLVEAQAPPVSAEALGRLADDAAAYLERMTGLVEDNGRAIAEYGAALSSSADALADPADPADSAATLEGLMALTRRMIERSRDASDHLRRSGAELDLLRTRLVEARHIAESDALTGLPNRRALDLRLTDACAVAVESGQPLSVAICDIDRFKQVNDLHGHPVGDEVIKLVGQALSDAGDAFVSRYGGEEFVILFAGLAAGEAARRIDAIRHGLGQRDIRITTTGLRLGRVTFSAGVAEIGPCGRPSTMLRRADRALYRAKDAGRDRVIVDTGDDPPPA